jgi:hypothetical protein
MVVALIMCLLPLANNLSSTALVGTAARLTSFLVVEETVGKVRVRQIGEVQVAREVLTKAFKLITVMMVLLLFRMRVCKQSFIETEAAAIFSGIGRHRYISDLVSYCIRRSTDLRYEYLGLTIRIII